MSSKEAQLLQFFDDDLCQDAARYRNLVAQLQALHDAICRRDSAQIESYNASLIELTGALHESSQRRSKIAQALHLAPSDATLALLIGKCPPARRAHLSAIATSLPELLEAARTQNAANGKLMAMHHDLISQLLANGQSPSLYQPQYF